MVSVEYKEAITEVLDILYNSEEDLLNKVPKKLIDFWERNKSTTYKPNLDHSKSINEMDLKKKTKSLISMIYLNYLCDNEERNSINLILKDNEEKYQQKLREKYNSDNIFKKYYQPQKIDENEVDNNVALMEYKETILKKIVNIMKRIFHRGK